MASEESSFKVEFRKAIERVYVNSKVWPNSSEFVSGIPDISVLHNGTFFGIEAKFVKTIPARENTRLLSHELSPLQYKFLQDITTSGNTAGIVIGFPNSFLAIPFNLWPKGKTNISLAEAKHYKDLGLEFMKLKGVWSVSGTLEALHDRKQ